MREDLNKFLDDKVKEFPQLEFVRSSLNQLPSEILDFIYSYNIFGNGFFNCIWVSRLKNFFILRICDGYYQFEKKFSHDRNPVVAFGSSSSLILSDTITKYITHLMKEDLKRCKEVHKIPANTNSLNSTSKGSSRKRDIG